MISTYLFHISIFAVVALCSGRIGSWFGKFRLPLISGFLFTGILAGPYMMGLINQESLPHLSFIDQVSLAIIAFAAGTELYWKELKDRWRSIAWVTSVQTFFVFTLGGLGVYLLADTIPFMSTMSTGGKLAVALLAGAILVARSPSSAIAIINELKAKGPFTQTVLGVTMVTDVVVIVLFAISLALAQPLLSSTGFSLGFLGTLGGELFTSLSLGLLLGLTLHVLLSIPFHRYIKRIGILLLGFGVFLFASWLRQGGHETLPYFPHLEPLLVCMVASFFVTNMSSNRAEFSKHLHRIAPPIYIAFFTLTGASLSLELLFQTWSIALMLVGLRLMTLFLGSWGGGHIAGDPTPHNRLSWMTYVTQAGVGLGLAKQVSTIYPTWGGAFATLMISVIVINQLVGPPFFKWAIHLIGEIQVTKPQTKPTTAPVPARNTSPGL